MYDKSDMSPCAGASLALDVCTHPGVMGGMCIRCGQKVEDESGVAFGYIHKVILHDSVFTKIHLYIHIFFSGWLGWWGNVESYVSDAFKMPPMPVGPSKSSAFWEDQTRAATFLERLSNIG